MKQFPTVLTTEQKHYNVYKEPRAFVDSDAMQANPQEEMELPHLIRLDSLERVAEKGVFYVTCRKYL